MKRLISILIIIAVLFTLCPAALGDDDVEALKKRIEELEAEIATKDAIIAALTKGSNTTEIGVVVVPPSTIGGSQITTKRNFDGNNLSEELSVPVGDDCFVIEACRTKFTERDTYTQMRMEVKIRNLTEYNPPQTKIGFLYKTIDENGDSLDSNTKYLGSTDIAPSGKAQWVESYSDSDGATGIMIFGYHIFGNVDIKGYFDEPIELYSKDYKITYDEIKGTGT